MTKLRVSQLDPGDAEEAQVVTLVDGKWQAANPSGGGGAGGAWHEDEIDIGVGSIVAIFALVPDPATISIQVWVNGILLRRDVDWEYTNPEPGDAEVTVPDLSEGDYVVLRWQEEV